MNPGSIPIAQVRSLWRKVYQSAGSAPGGAMITRARGSARRISGPWRWNLGELCRDSEGLQSRKHDIHIFQTYVESALAIQKARPRAHRTDERRSGIVYKPGSVLLSQSGSHIARLTSGILEDVVVGPRISRSKAKLHTNMPPSKKPSWYLAALSCAAERQVILYERGRRLSPLNRVRYRTTGCLHYRKPCLTGKTTIEVTTSLDHKAPIMNLIVTHDVPNPWDELNAKRNANEDVCKRNGTQT
ncbi:hypothetical protein B0H13DRAFT_1923963 [Mycena leptocephala]|nr:hypothetical protein B0H13DRAFT_1923963 [Mycena leptocephala]